MMFNMLLSSAGRQAFLVNAFREALKDRGLVFASDVNQDAIALKVADRGLVAPAYTDSSYIEWVVEACARGGVRLLVSLNVDDLLVLEPERKRLEKVGCQLVGGSPGLIEATHDKFKMFRFCRSLGLPVASTWSLEELSGNKNVKFPVIAKPRFGKGSRGIFLIDSERELECILNGESDLSCGGDYIFQEFIKGDEFGLDVVNDLDGNFAGILARKKIKMKNGETNIAITKSPEEWMNLGLLLGRGLKHQGTVDVDVMVSNGAPFVIDINFRFGGGYVFSHLAGANIPRAYISWALQESISPEWLSAKAGVMGRRDAEGGVAIVKRSE